MQRLKDSYGLNYLNTMDYPSDNEYYAGTIPEITATPQRNYVTLQEMRNRQAYMKAMGHNVNVRSRWNSSQQQLWDRLTTRQKSYEPTISGFFEGLADRIKGTDTYKIDPFNQGVAKQYDENDIDKSKTARKNNKLLQAVMGSYIPAGLIAISLSPIGRGVTGVANIFKSAQKAKSLLPLVRPTIQTAATIKASELGDEAVSKTWNDFTQQYLQFTPFMSEFLNPGYHVGGAMADLGTATLLRKSNPLTAGIRRNTLGKSYVDKARAVSYTNNGDGSGISKLRQGINVFTNALNPVVHYNVNKSDHTPAWFLDKKSPSIMEVFRNDAQRLSMGLEPRKIYLDDGTGLKPHSLYKKIGENIYDVDPEYVDYVKQNYYNPTIGVDNFLTAFPSLKDHSTHRIVHDHVQFGFQKRGNEIVANDPITMNGGFSNFKLPDGSVTVANPNKFSLYKYKTTSPSGTVMTDTYDINPLAEPERTVWPWATKHLLNIEKANIPIVSQAANNVRNLEVIDLFGGTPFKQRTVLPWHMEWYHN